MRPIIGDLQVVNGQFNKGFEFDGVLGNYVSVEHDKSLNLAEFTITYWCNITPKKGTCDISDFGFSPVMKQV